MMSWFIVFNSCVFVSSDKLEPSTSVVKIALMLLTNSFRSFLRI